LCMCPISHRRSELFIFRSQAHVGDRRASRTTPPPFFPVFVENKGQTVNRPLGDPCVTLG
jgi:hypothetical protein